MAAKSEDEEPESREAFWWDLEGHEMTFVENMQALRERRGWSQTAFAKRLNDEHGLPFHQPTIQRIEAGERPLKMHEAFSIANAFGVSFQAMHEDVSLTFAYDNLRDQMRWNEIKWSFERAQGSVRTAQLRIEEINDSLEDYREAGTRFSEPLNEAALLYADKMLALLADLAAILQSRDTELDAKVDEIKALMESEDEALPRDFHGEREWLKNWEADNGE